MAVSPVILQATSKHTASLIFLHGLGDTDKLNFTEIVQLGDNNAGHGWAQAMAQIRPSYMKVICPTAATMPVTLNAGFRMPSWFDLKTLDMYGPEDEDGIKLATANIQSLIQSEISSGIQANRIIIGGFSQGGALALHSGLTFSQPLGGIIALSCWLPLHKSFPDAKKTADTVPIFQCHGEIDPVVPYKFGQLSHYSLKTFMKNAQFSSYPGLSHSSSEQEMDDVKDFVEKSVPPQ